MRTTFGWLTIILILFGFAVPIAWAGAVVTFVVAISCPPAGLRPDGKSRTGGLFGGAIDSLVVSAKMTECPYCMTRSMKTARRCTHCQEHLTSDIKI